jgi:squalene synthase HpnC
MPTWTSSRAARPGGDREGARPRGLASLERAENFPVALRVLPRRFRTHLRAVYDVVRVIDDLGDRAAGDRVALLDGFGRDLAALWTGGTPGAAVLRRLAPTVRACGLERAPFDHLIAANLADQRVTRYASYDDLLGYCRLSADPVGRLVLAIFGASTPATRELSDRVCTALQLIEHWQDVAEDRRAGRVYLPGEDLARFGVAETDLDRPTASVPVRRLVAFQTDRAADLLDSGAPLLGLLRGWARVAVAGYLAGGRAAVAAIRRADHDVLAGSPRARRRDVAAHLAACLVANRAASRAAGLAASRAAGPAAGSGPAGRRRVGRP